MASYIPAKKGVAYIAYVSLVSQASTLVMQANPTIASGDFKVSIDGGALANLTTLPTVTPVAGKMVKISLSTSEMNGDNITVVCSDAAGAEWCDLVINIQTAARQIDDLAFPATSGRSMVVDAAGLVDANAVKVGPTGSGTAQTAGDLTAQLTAIDDFVDTEVAAIKAKTDNLPSDPADASDIAAAFATVASGIAAVQADTDNIQTRLPAALTSGGNMKSGVQGFLDSVFTEGAAGRIAAGFKQFFNIASPAATMDHGILVDTVTNLTNASALESGTAQAGAASTITLRSGASAVNSYYLNAIVSITGGTGAGQSRVITAYVGSTKVATVDRAWATNPDSSSTYSIAALAPKLNASGEVVAASVTGAAASVTNGVTVTANNDKTGYGLSSGERTTLTAAIWNALVSGLTTSSSIGKRIVDYLTGDVYGRVGAPVAASISADIAAVKALDVAIKAKTDNLPADPAGISSVPTANANADALLDRTAGVQTSWTLRQALRIILASAAGKLSGAATTTVVIRDPEDGKNRISATVDASGNRSAVSYDKT